jgi:hypothetical protein
VIVAADSSFVDALSVFALIGLVGVAVVAVVTLVLETRSKRTNLQNARKGLGHVEAASPRIRDWGPGEEKRPRTSRHSSLRPA